jgi:hypothetical protein
MAPGRVAGSRPAYRALERQKTGKPKKKKGVVILIPASQDFKIRVEAMGLPSELVSDSV